MRSEIKRDIPRLMATVLVLVIFGSHTGLAQRVNQGSGPAVVVEKYGRQLETNPRPTFFQNIYGQISDPDIVEGSKPGELLPLNQCSDDWYDGLPVSGVNGLINAIAFDETGNIYVGGGFTIAGNVEVSNIAKWDGSRWSALGTGINGEVRAIAVSGPDVFAGGAFTIAGGTAVSHVAKWNGANWSAIGAGLDNSVTDIEMSGPDIYVGGTGYANGVPEGYVAKWNGSNWTNLGSGMDGTVMAIGVSGTDVYAGGSFTSAGETPANRVAKWDESN